MSNNQLPGNGPNRGQITDQITDLIMERHLKMDR